MKLGHALQRPIVIVSAAALLILLAAGMIWSNLRAGHGPIATADARVQPKTVTQVVSAANIARGQALAANDLTLRTIAATAATGDTLQDVSQAIDHMALAPIAAGAPVLRSAISAAALTGISAKIPQGYRAFAIPVSDVDIAGGFLQTGDVVDLYVTLPGALFGMGETLGRRPDDQSKSTLLLQDVSVLAVGTKLKTDGTPTTGVRTVTLALHSEVLSEVALAARLGTISLAIRNLLDRETASNAISGLDTLLGGAKAATAPLPETRRQVPPVGGAITVYSGRDRTTVHATP